MNRAGCSGPPFTVMDVIYPYKRHRDGFELRMSLRSLRHADPGRVIVAGDPVPWLSAQHVPVGHIANRFLSSTANIRAATEVSDAECVMVMHDDIFLLQNLDYRHENRGTIEEYLSAGKCAGEYRRHVETTRDMLADRGVADPLWFGLHTPTVYNRRKLLDLIDELDGQPLLLRTVFHNLHPSPSTRRDDVKLYSWSGVLPADDYLSVSDSCALMPRFRSWLTARFPDPSPYERAP